MKKILKKRYIRKVERIRSFAPGWPLEILIADCRPRYNDERRHYKKQDSYCRTKAGRLDGSYEYYFGKKPSRISHGN